MKQGFGLFLQVTGLILLPSVFIWAMMGKVSARTELTVLAFGAALFYLGTLVSKRRGG